MPSSHRQTRRGSVESCCAKLTRQRIRRGSFHGLVALQAAIKRDLAEHNADPGPLVRTASASAITATLDRLDAATA